MARFGVGVMHNTINSRFGPKPLVHADYAIGLACGADSFWVADHLNSVLPPSMWTPKHVGAARLIPKMDAHLEPWTILGYLAGRNKLGRMQLGVAVTDTGRRNPAVTAQAAASLHLLTRGRAVLGIGTGERESNAPYGVDWSKPVARFEEAVATIRALWNSNGELVTRDSPFFPLHNATFALPPYRGSGRRSGLPLTAADDACHRTIRRRLVSRNNARRRIRRATRDCACCGFGRRAGPDGRHPRPDPVHRHRPIPRRNRRGGGIRHRQGVHTQLTC